VKGTIGQPGGRTNCIECQTQQQSVSGIALGGLLLPARWSLENSGSGRLLAPGGGDVPPGGLGLCRLAVLVLRRVRI